MTEDEVRVCAVCGDPEENVRFDACAICRRVVCADCAERAFGRRFCSHECARAYAFSGESDDDDENADE